MRLFVRPIVTRTGLPLLFLALGILPAPAQVPRSDPGMSPLYFEHFTPADGLSSVRVWDILQDRQGFLWIATGDGLNRYDGHTFTVFRARGPGAISHDQVWALLEDHAGTLWVGTYRGGLNRFDAATQTFMSYRHTPDDPGSLGHDDIRVLYESPREPGILWIGTYGGGLDHFDTRTAVFTHYRHDPDDPTSLPSDTVYTIHEDRAGTLWVGTTRGVAQINRPHLADQTPGTPAPSDSLSFTPYPPPSGNATPGDPLWTSAILEDHTGALWVGTAESGLYRFDRATGGFTRFVHDPDDPTSLSQNQILTLFEDADGTLWVGTYGGGLNRFDRATGGFTRFVHDPNDPASLNDNIVRSIYQDRSGTLWVGAWQGGLNKIRRDKFITFRYQPGKANSLRPGKVHALAEDEEGGLWVGMDDGGLVRITQTEGASPIYTHIWLHRPAPNTLVTNAIEALLVPRREPGVLWIGAPTGLHRLDRRTGVFAHFRHVPGDATSLDNDAVRAVRESLCEPGVLWVATEGVLNRFDRRTGVFTRIAFAEEEPGLGPPAPVRTVLTTAQEPCTVWFTAGNYGLFKLTDSRLNPSEEATTARTYTVENYRYSHSNLSAQAWELWYQSDDERLWLEAYEGLLVFDPKTESFTAYTEENGLPGIWTKGVLPDNEGMLWIATTRALTRLNPETGTFRTYDAADGLQEQEFLRRSFLKGRDGTLYFGGLEGITAIRLDLLAENRHVPPVVLTDFRLFNRPVPIDPTAPDDVLTLSGHISKLTSLVLPHRASVMSFDFAALDFTAPEKNQYAYTMEGFDEEWTQAGTRHTVTYTNLDPGKYVFRVKGTNNDGVWNEEGARLALTILPPWYQTWWFYGLLGVFFAVGGPMAYVLRIRRLKAREAELEQTVAERTAELRRANELKSRFLANISHEFRTPLTLTFGPLDDALEGRFASFDEARPHFERARRNGGRLLRLINQLLDLSKLDAGALLLQAHRHDLTAHLRQLAGLFDAIAQNRRITFTTLLPDAPLLHVYDADKIEKAVINLLSNAFKFTPEGGKISLTLTREAEEGVRIEVADTGPGIAEEYLPHLFDRFYQVESATTRTYEGTGIGLALAKELVELHEGMITVESTVGFGTRFTVCLPALEAAEADVPKTNATDKTVVAETTIPVNGKVDEITDSLSVPTASPGAPTSIYDGQGEPEAETVVLVVEDNADMRAYIRSHLEDIVMVVEAENGRAGLEQAVEVVPDLVLSDVMMPEMDGLNLCQAVKADERTSHIPVVLLTARAQVEHRIAGFESGADAYLPKPFNAEELRVRVRTLIAERRRLWTRFAGRDPQTAGLAEEPAASSLPPREAAFLVRLETIVTERLDDATFSVDELADMLALSPRQLLRKLRALTGETTAGMIRRIRLDHAARSLASGTTTIKEVAFAVGFNNESAFSRAFSQQYGVSPSAYAAQHQQE